FVEDQTSVVAIASQGETVNTTSSNAEGSLQCHDCVRVLSVVQLRGFSRNVLDTDPDGPLMLDFELIAGALLD
ncbi:MAG TPA: hypothetical protein VGD31_12845, partial [Sphingobacteriaceae bacterium]